MSELSVDSIRKHATKMIGVYADDLKESQEAIAAVGCEPYAMLVFKDFKTRTRAMGNALAQLANGAPFQKDPALMAEIRMLTAALSYLLNSSSLDDDKLHDFDLKEIDRKLRRTR